MQSLDGAPEATSECAPAECPHCHVRLSGVLVMRPVWAPQDVCDHFGPAVALRTAKAWMREPWSGSYRLDGVRPRLVDSRPFCAAILRQRQQPGRPHRPFRDRNPQREFRTSCQDCEVGLGGFVAPIEFATVPEIVEFLGTGVRDVTVNSWIRSGKLRGFKLPGIRGLLVEVNDLFDDLEAMKHRGRLRVRGDLGLATGGDS